MLILTDFEDGETVVVLPPSIIRRVEPYEDTFYNEREEEVEHVGSHVHTDEDDYYVRETVSEVKEMLKGAK